MVHRSVLLPRLGRASCPSVVRSWPPVADHRVRRSVAPVWLAGCSVDGSVGTMTHRSHADRYLRRPALTTGESHVAAARRVDCRAVRVRTFELRLIAPRPGGVLGRRGRRRPDRLPARRPDRRRRRGRGARCRRSSPSPASPGRRSRAATGRSRRWSGSPPARLLVLVPSIADVTGQLGGRGAQTLLPSVEAAYPWVLGADRDVPVHRVRDRPAPARRERRCAGAGWSAGSSSRRCSPPAAAMVFAAVAMGNELALRDRIASSSRFGPTDIDREPPTCDGPMGIGPTARLDVHLDGDARRPLDRVDRPRRRARPSPTSAGSPTSRRPASSGCMARRPIGDAAWIRAAVRRLAARDAGRGRATRISTCTAFRIGALARGRGRRRNRAGVGVIEGAARAAVPDRDRRARPSGRRSRRSAGWSATPTSPTGGASSTTGSSSTARSGGSPAASTATRRTSRPGALQATIRVDLTATDRGAPIRRRRRLREAVTRPRGLGLRRTRGRRSMAADGRGARIRQARPAGPDDPDPRPAQRPSRRHEAGRDRPAGRLVGPDRLPRPPLDRGRARACRSGRTAAAGGSTPTPSCRRSS